MNYRSSTGRKRVPLAPSEAPMEEQRLVFAGTGRSRGLEGRLRALSENGYPPIPVDVSIPHTPLSGWWLSPTPLKNMSSSVGMITFPTEWNNKIHVPNHQSAIVRSEMRVYLVAN